MAVSEVARGGAQAVEVPSDFGDKPEDRVAYWLAQDKLAEKSEQRWMRQGRRIVKRYRDERPATGAIADMHLYNILWSNVQTLEPAIYARSPKADVERRFKDQDPVGRLASILLERAIAWSLDACEFDTSMKSTVKDYLLPGRGTIRVIYCPYYGEPIEPEEGETEEESEDETGEQTERWGSSTIVANDGDENVPLGPDNKAAEARPRRPPEAKQSTPRPLGEPLREVVDEDVKLHYVFWEDYREGPARQWSEVPWIRYRAYLNRTELVDRFGQGKGKLVNLDAPIGGDMKNQSNSRSTQDKGDLLPSVLKEAEIWEIWDKAQKRVIWVAPGSADLGFLDQVDDPLELPDFFPSPDPLLATTTTDTRIPVPDYVEYQDQANEMDVLTARIDRLIRALKVSGIYAASEKQAIQQLIDEGTENKMIPVENWAVWADKGGLKNVIEWFPIQQIAETLIQLYDARDRTKQVLYEITGMSDIMRGQTSPVETATAQQLKAQFGTLRLNDRQRAVARFARDCIRLVGYVIAGQFSNDSISKLTGYPKLQRVPPPPPPSPMQIDPQTGQPMPDQAMMQYQQVAQGIMQQNQMAQQQFDEACELIRNDMPNGFRIDIEADSTILPDEQAEKQSRVEFMGALTPFLTQVLPMATGNPAFTDFAKDATLFLTRGFRAGREMEESIEKMFEALGKMPPPQPPGQKQETQPDPQIGQAKMIEAQTKAQSAQAEAATNAQSVQAKTAIDAQDSQAKAAAAFQKNQQDFELDKEKNLISAQHNAQVIALREREVASNEEFKAAQLRNKQAESARGLE